MTDQTNSATDLDDDELDKVSGALLLPAVQAAGDEKFVVKPKAKVWPWHYW